MPSKKLHLGCGRKILEGFVNLDMLKLSGVDVVWDLNRKPYPFKNDYFEEVFCSHVLEHVNDLFVVMGELSRICRKGASINVVAPYFSGQGAFNDPQHKRFFGYKTFDYFSKSGFYSAFKFKVVKRKIFFFSSKSFMKSALFSAPIDFMINVCPMVYQRFFCWIFPASEIHYKLEVLK